MIKRIMLLLFILTFINAQIELPTFQAVHTPHSTATSGTVTFTNCGSTLYDGPSQSDCDSEYSGTSLDGDVTVSVGIQSWTVTSNDSYTITAKGARGADSGSSGGDGANGASIKGIVSLSANDVLTILVGQMGNNNGNNYAGGGGGGSYNGGTSQENTAGANSGHGQVVITW